MNTAHYSDLKSENGTMVVKQKADISQKIVKIVPGKELLMRPKCAGRGRRTVGA